MSSVEPTRRELRLLEIENQKHGNTLAPVPRESWPVNIILGMDNPPAEVWRSARFLVQVFTESGGVERLSICRTSHNGQSWQDNITWDELQMLKTECGRGTQCAVEIYPAERDVVNVANMRHLWLLPEPPAYAWRKAR